MAPRENVGDINRGGVHGRVTQAHLRQLLDTLRHLENCFEHIGGSVALTICSSFRRTKQPYQQHAVTDNVDPVVSGTNAYSIMALDTCFLEECSAALRFTRTVQTHHAPLHIALHKDHSPSNFARLAGKSCTGVGVRCSDAQSSFPREDLTSTPHSGADADVPELLDSGTLLVDFHILCVPSSH